MPGERRTFVFVSTEVRHRRHSRDMLFVWVDGAPVPGRGHYRSGGEGDVSFIAFTAPAGQFESGRIYDVVAAMGTERRILRAARCQVHIPVRPDRREDASDGTADLRHATTLR